MPDFTGVQAISDTVRQLPDLTHHQHGYCSVIEETVEGFIEVFCPVFSVRQPQ